MINKLTAKYFGHVEFGDNAMLVDWLYTKQNSPLHVIKCGIVESGTAGIRHYTICTCVFSIGYFTGLEINNNLSHNFEVTSAESTLRNTRTWKY